LLPALILGADLWRDTHAIFISKTCFAFLPLLVLLLVRAWRCAPSRTLSGAGLVGWSLLLAAAMVSNIYTRSVRQIPYEDTARHLAGSDTAAHLVVLSSTVSGYAIPLLLSLRDAGVRHVRVLHSPPARLAAAVDHALLNPAIQQVSLIDLEVTYRLQQRYEPELLDRVAAQARQTRWRVRVLSPGAVVAEPPAPERTLWILTPIQAKYFAK
jgi:hypothetical protein